MFRHVMPDPRTKIPEGYHVEHPNREKAGSKLTKFIVFLLLLGSAVLLLIVTLGGWEKLAGARFVQIAYIAVYVLMAFFVLRWNRGVLPMAAALAMILGIFAGIAGPEWFARDKPGYSQPELDEAALGTFTLLIVPVQFLLIVAAMTGFAQGWNVEVEVPDGEHYHPGRHGPATA
jgi:hypothetical protein